jgi:hypothetical protein
LGRGFSKHSKGEVGMGKRLLNGYTDEMKKPVFSILNSSYTKEIFSPTSCVNVVFFSDMFF